MEADSPGMYLMVIAMDMQIRSTIKVGLSPKPEILNVLICQGQSTTTQFPVKTIYIHLPQQESIELVLVAFRNRGLCRDDG